MTGNAPRPVRGHFAHPPAYGTGAEHVSSENGSSVRRRVIRRCAGTVSSAPLARVPCGVRRPAQGTGAGHVSSHDHGARVRSTETARRGIVAALSRWRHRCRQRRSPIASTFAAICGSRAPGTVDGAGFTRTIHAASRSRSAQKAGARAGGPDLRHRASHLHAGAGRGHEHHMVRLDVASPPMDAEDRPRSKGVLPLPPAERSRRQRIGPARADAPPAVMPARLRAEPRGSVVPGTQWRRSGVARAGDPLAVAPARTGRGGERRGRDDRPLARTCHPRRTSGAGAGIPGREGTVPREAATPAAHVRLRTVLVVALVEHPDVVRCRPARGGGLPPAAPGRNRPTGRGRDGDAARGSTGGALAFRKGHRPTVGSVKRELGSAVERGWGRVLPQRHRHPSARAARPGRVRSRPVGIRRGRHRPRRGASPRIRGAPAAQPRGAGASSRAARSSTSAAAGEVGWRTSRGFWARIASPTRGSRRTAPR